MSRRAKAVAHREVLLPVGKTIKKQMGMVDDLAGLGKKKKPGMKQSGRRRCSAYGEVMHVTGQDIDRFGRGTIKGRAVRRFKTVGGSAFKSKVDEKLLGGLIKTAQKKDVTRPATTYWNTRKSNIK